MKTLAIIFVFVGICSISAQFTQENSRSLFSDVKAFSQGDALMVLIMEETQAGNSASTSEKRGTDLSGGFDLSTGTSASNTRFDVGLGTGNEFGAKGENSRSERIRSRMSVRVESVDQNGNLQVSGTRTTKVNGETQKITISGLVRPVDILPDNSLYSYSILDLTLTIEGEGNLTEIQEPGLLTQFFRLLF